MDASPFVKLPGELRNKIYAYSLQQDEPILVTTPSAPPNALAQERTSDPLALAQKCRGIRSECYQMFYANNTITILTNDANQLHPQLIEFHNAIGPETAALIRTIIIDIGTVPISKTPRHITTTSKDVYLIFVYALAAKDALFHNIRVKLSLLDEAANAVEKQPSQVVQLDLDVRNLRASWDENFDAFRNTDVPRKNLSFAMRVNHFARVFKALLEVHS